MIRAWFLCYNPVDDCIFSLASSDARVMLAEPIGSNDERGGCVKPCFEIVEGADGEDAGMMVSVDAHERRNKGGKEVCGLR